MNSFPSAIAGSNREIELYEHPGDSGAFYFTEDFCRPHSGLDALFGGHAKVADEQRNSNGEDTVAEGRGTLNALSSNAVIRDGHRREQQAGRIRM